MIKVLYIVGLPASGKTTYAKNWVQESPKDRARVNRDDIRRMLGMYYKEDLVTDIEWNCIVNCIKRKYSVIIDATNFKLDEKLFRQKLADELYINAFAFSDKPHDIDIDAIHNSFELIKIDFTNVSVEECIRRDSERKYPVGEEVIKKMAKKYLGYVE